MEYRSQYLVTEELQKQGSRQLFFSVALGKKWIGVTFLWLLSIFALSAASMIGWIAGAALLGVSLVLTLLWVKTYFALQKNAIDYLKTVDDPTTNLLITEEFMEVSNSSGSKKVLWEKVEKLEETEDFLIPMVGKVPIICLPRIIWRMML